MVVRAWPLLGTAGDYEAFAPSVEQHEAQHNIEVSAANPGAGGPRGQGRHGGADEARTSKEYERPGSEENPVRSNKETGFHEINVTAGSLRDDAPERVRIMAAVDPEPRRDVARAAVPLIKKRKTIKGFARGRFPRLGIHVDDANAEPLGREMNVEPRGVFKKGRLEHEVEVVLEPRRLYNVRFQVEMRKAEPGAAYVFHLKQVGEDGVEHGGLTEVLHRLP